MDSFSSFWSNKRVFSFKNLVVTPVAAALNALKKGIYEDFSPRPRRRNTEFEQSPTHRRVEEEFVAPLWEEQDVAPLWEEQEATPLWEEQEVAPKPEEEPSKLEEEAPKLEEEVPKPQEEPAKEGGDGKLKRKVHWAADVEEKRRKGDGDGDAPTRLEEVPKGGDEKRKRKVHWAPDVEDKRRKYDRDAPTTLGDAFRRHRIQSMARKWASKKVGKRNVPSQKYQDFLDRSERMARRSQLGLDARALEYMPLPRPRTATGSGDRVEPETSDTVINPRDQSKQAGGEDLVLNEKERDPPLGSGFSIREKKLAGISGIPKTTMGKSTIVKPGAKQLGLSPGTDDTVARALAIQNKLRKEFKPIPDLITRLFGESKSFTMEPLKTAFQSRESGGTKTGVAVQNSSGTLSDDKMDITPPEKELPPVPTFETGFVNPQDILRIVTRGCRKKS